MEASGDLVCVVVELTSCVELGKNDFQSALSFSWMYVYGDTSSVVLYSAYFAMLAMFKIDLYVIAESSHCFVDGVVQYLIHQMMEAVYACGSDVHSGPLPDGFKPLEYRNARRIVLDAGLKLLFKLFGGVSRNSLFFFVHFMTFMEYFLTRVRENIYNISYINYHPQ